MPLQIIRQDMTKMQVDAIVNTTNKKMVSYSGVDLAVHTAAGPLLDVECYKKANVDKKTFSKIKCNPDTYKPSKQTAVSHLIKLSDIIFKRVFTIF